MRTASLLRCPAPARLRTVTRAVLLTLMLSAPASAQSVEDSKAGEPPDVRVSRVAGLALSREVTVTVEGLAKLIDRAGGDLSKIVLHLDGYPLIDLPARRVSINGPQERNLQYSLQRTERSSDAWTALLGRPKLFPPRPRLVRVSVGLKNEPVHTDVTEYPLWTVDPTRYVIYVVVLLALAAAFGISQRTAICFAIPVRPPVPRPRLGHPRSPGRTASSAAGRYRAPLWSRRPRLRTPSPTAWRGRRWRCGSSSSSRPSCSSGW